MGVYITIYLVGIVCVYYYTGSLVLIDRYFVAPSRKGLKERKWQNTDDGESGREVQPGGHRRKAAWKTIKTFGHIILCARLIIVRTCTCTCKYFIIVSVFTVSLKNFKGNILIVFFNLIWLPDQYKEYKHKH